MSVAKLPEGGGENSLHQVSSQDLRTPTARPDRRPLRPFWEYDQGTPIALPRPGDPGWVDPLDGCDLGPLSDEKPANDGGR